MDDKKNYDKIGGWLILCAVGLLLYPVQTAVHAVHENRAGFIAK